MTSPSSIDLHLCLADLAGSVHDDALASRLTGQVRPMVGRIRRRRAARATAVGTVGLGTVAAVAVGAVALAGRGGSSGPGPAPPATGVPDGVTEAEEAVEEIVEASPAVTEDHPFGECGTAVPPIPPDALLALELDLDDGTGFTAVAGDRVQAIAVLTTTTSTRVLGNVPEDGATVVLTRDGVVVGRAEAEPGDVLHAEVGTDEPLVFYGNGAAQVCALPGTEAPGLGLPPGTYQAYGVMPVTYQEIQRNGKARSVSDSVVVRSEPLDLTVLPPSG